MGALVYRALCDIAARVVFWCVGVPAAALFAAYLVGIAAMCARELRTIRKNDQARRKRHEKTDPDL